MEWLLEILTAHAVDALIPLIRDILIAVLIILVGLVGAPAAKWWRNLKIDGWIKETIEEGVLFAQEKYWDKEGKEKFEYAKAYILTQLSEWGIELSETKLDKMIDAVVKRLKAEFGDLWYNDPPKGDDPKASAK